MDKGANVLGNIYQGGNAIKEAILKNGLDNRRHPRRKVSWRFEGYNKLKNRFNGKTENVSKSGLSLIINSDCHAKLILGNRIFLKFQVYYQAKTRTFEGVAVIKHCSVGTAGRKLGVEFVNMNEENKKWLSNFSQHII